MPWQLGEGVNPPVYHFHDVDKYKGKYPEKIRKAGSDWLVPRTDWGAVPPKFTEILRRAGPPPQKLPPITMPNHIHFSHTNTEECFDRESCSNILRSTQEKHFSSGEPDILHSFMIGGDGNVYEGRGWFTQCNVPEDFTTYFTASIEIAVIGDFSRKIVPKEMKKTLKKLLEWGIVNEKLYCCFNTTFNYQLHAMYFESR